MWQKNRPHHHFHLWPGGLNLRMCWSLVLGWKLKDKMVNLTSAWTYWEAFLQKHCIFYQYLPAYLPLKTLLLKQNHFDKTISYVSRVCFAVYHTFPAWEILFFPMKHVQALFHDSPELMFLIKMFPNLTTLET